MGRFSQWSRDIRMDDGINVLITCAGRRVELVEAFKAARDALGLRGGVFCGDGDPRAPALAFADGCAIFPSLSSPSYPEALAAFAREKSATLVIPTIDTELALLAGMRETFLADTGARIVVSPPELVAICRDKAMTARFLAGEGIPSPRTWTSAADALADSPEWPLIVKPSDGSSSQNVFTARDRRELDFFARYVPNAIIQERLEGQEYSVDAFFDFGSRPVVAVPRRRIAVRAGEILRGAIDMSPEALAAVRPLQEALSRLGAVGVATIQGFLCRDGVFRFTEINPRFGGGAPMSIAAGADFPGWLYRLAAGMPLPEKPAVRDGILFSRFDGMVEVSPQANGAPRHG